MLSKEEIEKAKERINKFMNNEMQRDKLEIDNRCGGWKIGDVYKHLELNPAIETLLQYIEQLEQEIQLSDFVHECDINKIYQLEQENNKQNKIIDLMAGSINSYDSQLDICYFKDKEHVKQHYEEYLEQYFEKKVEEK